MKGNVGTKDVDKAGLLDVFFALGFISQVSILQVPFSRDGHLWLRMQWSPYNPMENCKWPVPLSECKSMVLDGIHPRDGKSWWRNLPSHFSARLSAGYYTWVTTPCSGVGLGESGWKFACQKRTRGCWLAAGWTVSSVPRWPRKPTASWPSSDQGSDCLSVLSSFC